ncbi:MAG: cysteine--tRNA ligase [Candidatus Borkfalkiaceae bacterium]|nr:cysteine--tRNA ligase [Christensenellaceae bacterium]
MKIYNSLTRQKEEFVPMEEDKVKMYACGITVSGEAHVGHGYQALIYDIMRKYLEKKGYKVTYARNYTDVDDKIIAKSRETGIPADVYAENMIKNIDSVMRRFNVDDPDLWLKATQNIGNIIDFIQGLIDKGHAYAAGDGNVYFDVDTYPAYGHLSGRNLEDALDGVRVENDEKKKHAYDFALWKAAKEGEICWDSPWGKGRPGWHIECSAMNRAAFGDQIDLHGGGRDLIFPHHENEIAQSEALTGKRFVKYWTHNGLIKVNGQKMSKSLGNSLLLSDLLDKYSDEAIKFALLQTNYRGDINITDDLFPEAEKHMHDFYLTLAEAEKAAAEGLKATDDDKKYAEKADRNFDAAMDDDFNTALALSDLFALFKEIRADLAKKDGRGIALAEQVKKTYSLLGLFRKSPAEYLAFYDEKHAEKIPEEIIAVAEERKAARAAKDWKKSDELREKLAALGYAVKDTKDGYELKKA